MVRDELSVMSWPSQTSEASRKQQSVSVSRNLHSVMRFGDSRNRSAFGCSPAPLAALRPPKRVSSCFRNCDRRSAAFAEPWSGSANYGQTARARTLTDTPSVGDARAWAQAGRFRA